MAAVGEVESETRQRRFSPGIKLVALLVGLGGVIVALKGCGEGNHPNVTDETIPPTTLEVTTTTVPEPPYWEEFGWTGPEDSIAMNENLAQNDQNLKIAAGRCAVMSTTGVSESDTIEYWEILRNPIITEGNVGGHEFTTFSAYQAFRSSDNMGQFALTPYTSVIDGELQWGKLGTIPDQTLMIDVPWRLTVETESFSSEVFDATYFPSSESTKRYFRNVAIEEGIIPAELVVIPKDEEWKVPEYCDVPALNFRDPPVSKT